jgi:hypothetical protein
MPRSVNMRGGYSNHVFVAIYPFRLADLMGSGWRGSANNRLTLNLPWSSGRKP